MKIRSIVKTIKSNKKSFFNISYYFSASLIRSVISLAINPLIALNLTHYDYALIGYFTSFHLLFTPFLSFMFGQYYSRMFFKIDHKKRDKLHSTLFSSQFIFGSIELIFILIGFSIYAHLQNIEFPVFPYALLSFSTIFLNLKSITIC